MTCDAAAGLYPSFVTDGCALRVQLDLTPEWMAAFTFVVVGIVFMIAALVVLQLRR